MTRYVNEAAPTGDSAMWAITYLLGQLLGAPLDWQYSLHLHGTPAMYHLIDRENCLGLSSNHEY